MVAAIVPMPEELIDGAAAVLQAGPDFTGVSQGDTLKQWLQRRRLPSDAAAMTKDRNRWTDALRRLGPAECEELQKLLRAFDAAIFNLAVRAEWALNADGEAPSLKDLRDLWLRPEIGMNRDRLRARLWDSRFRAEVLALLAPLAGPVPFEEVLRQELGEMRCSRRERGVEVGIFAGDGVYAQAHSAQLVGLALSGGGIRSATFNLGVIQALSEMRILESIDYASTASGGGYIGSWLAAWNRRAGPDAVREGLKTDKAANPDFDIRRPIRTLRQYSSYLAPSRGPLSADTWTLVTIWIRNTLLNLIILLSALICLLVAPRCLMAVASRVPWNPPALWAILLIAGLLVNVLILLNLRFFSCSSEEQSLLKRRRDETPWYSGEPAIKLLILLPSFVSAICMGAFFWSDRNALAPEIPLPAGLHVPLGVLFWFPSWAYFYMVGWLGGFPDCFRRRTRLHRRRGHALLLLLSGVSSMVATALAVGAAELFSFWHRGHTAPDRWAMFVWSTPLMVVHFSLAAILFIGLLGLDFPDQRREWCARLGAWLSIWIIGWSVWFGTAVYGPLLVSIFVDKAHGWIASTVTAGWIFTTLAGLLAGKHPKTGSNDSPAWLNILAKVAPPVFIAGLLLILSTLLDLALPRIHGDPATLRHLHSLTDTWKQCGLWKAVAAIRYSHWKLLDGGSGLETLWVLFGAAAVGAFLAWRFDVNEFSMHHFYRNRLMRCYLGASTVNRHANKFTGLDANDDLALARMTPTLRDPEFLAHYSGPYPIINTALNLVTGEDLAWQERKASSFVFTPRYCGYDVRQTGCPPQNGLAAHGYRPTADYAYPPTGIHVGTAAAISGAAASPNWGYHSSPSVAFLLTIFNVRLGWWVGNPRHTGTWQKSGPGMGLFYLLSELTGRANDSRGYVYLSDGGHFENLGIYELVRRRCRFIIASDAGEDPAFSFEDLGNAIRKCRNDFGIDIEINVERIRAQPDSARSQWHCAIGVVHYELVDQGATPGTLVYMKSSLSGDEPTDVLEYAALAPEFPHQTTLNQFFQESIFESYRSLGHHIAITTFQSSAKELAVRNSRPLDNKEAFFFALQQTWFPPSSAVEKSFSKHGEALNRLSERFRSDDRLRFLDSQVYPEWKNLMERVKPESGPRALVSGFLELFAANPPKIPTGNLWLPDTYEEIRSGFHFCASIIQLMENVYLDLNLETESSHPDNRGWINLFHHWSWSGMLRVTWAITANTYGARFQKFCERYLKLRVGNIHVIPANPETEFNFLEARLMTTLLKKRGVPFADATCWALRISVRDPNEEVKYEMLDAGESLSDAGGASRPFEFTFGFAIVHERKLTAFRVQDHLRGLELTRDAMVRLIEKNTIDSMSLWQYPANFRDLTSQEDQEIKEHLFASAWYEIFKDKPPVIE